MLTISQVGRRSIRNSAGSCPLFTQSNAEAGEIDSVRGRDHEPIFGARKFYCTAPGATADLASHGLEIGVPVVMELSKGTDREMLRGRKWSVNSNRVAVVSGH